MRKTKIVCTLGPATDGEGVLREMMLAGMNVARFNFSHGTHPEHKARLEQVKALRQELDLPVAAMLDTKGPEVRLKNFAGGSVTLQEGQEFTLTVEDVEGDATRCAVTYAELPQDVKAGDTILLDDGLVRLTVLSTTASAIRCRVENGGVMKDHKGVNVPGVSLSMPYMSQQDRRCAGAPQAAGEPQVPHPYHRQDRESGGHQQPDGDSGSGGRHHGGTRRHGRGDRLHGDPRHPEE